MKIITVAWLRTQWQRLLYGAVVYLVVALLVGIGHLIAAPVAIRLKSTPSAAFAGSVFKFEIRLIPEATDRWIALAFEPNVVGDGIWQIEGQDALPIYQMSRRLTLPGQYHVSAAVGHGENARAVSTITLLVAE